MERTARLGYPVEVIVPLGVVVLVCVPSLIPRTAVLGTILLTAFLGEAMATQLRVQDDWFFFPVVLGMLAWLRLFCANNNCGQVFYDAVSLRLGDEKCQNSTAGCS